MSEAKLTQQEVGEILKMIEDAEHVAEFHLKYGDIEVRLSRAQGPAAMPVLSAAATAAIATTPAATPVAAPQPVKPAQSVAPGMAVVKSPMVGTFYRASSPGAKPFVEVGQKVKSDAVVCIIEVMKLMNSIAAGVNGTVREIRVADSQAVAFGEVLIVIQPDG